MYKILKVLRDLCSQFEVFRFHSVFRRVGMLIIYKVFVKAIVALAVCFLSFTSVLANPSTETKELLAVVETSCKKSCMSKNGEQKFCTSYCQCIRGRVEAKAARADIYKILSKPENNKTLISQCSGQTALKFFSSSCRSKCDGAPKCSSYCSCMENKIKFKKKLSDIGNFFIQLGEKRKAATSRLKRFEASCMR